VLHPTPDQLTTAALPGTEKDPEVAGHLATCASCAAEVDALRCTVVHARDGMALQTAPPPPPAVWDGILARLDADDDVADAPGAPDELGARRDARWTRQRALRAGTAALVAAAAVIAVIAAVLTGTPAAPPATDRVALVAARPGVVGEVVGGPASMHVEVTLPGPAPAGSGLEVWDMATGTPRSLGVLQPTDGGTHWVGDLAAPAAGGMPPLDVSLEPPGDDPGHSGLSLAHTP
jgi:anti-sigma-K factor RskA